MQSTLRSWDLAHLAHVELFSPKPDESLRFFTEIVGMTESATRGDSVYLRAGDDYEHHDEAHRRERGRDGSVAFRATGEALEHRAAIIDAAGFGAGWTDGDLGHGRTYAFTTDGHRMEIYTTPNGCPPP
jgi:catechol 2,3-dioxygenase